MLWLTGPAVSVFEGTVRRSVTDPMTTRVIERHTRGAYEQTTCPRRRQRRRSAKTRSPTICSGNPDFFERHATLLTKLKLPHNRGGAAVSLVERQVLALRDKNQALETRLRELIEVARGNDVLAAQDPPPRLPPGARRATRAALLDALEASLREDFGASEWLLLLAPRRRVGRCRQLEQPAPAHASQPGAPELKMFETLFESGRPRCGQIRDSQRDYLFGAGTVEIGSAALVPLGQASSLRAACSRSAAPTRSASIRP